MLLFKAATRCSPGSLISSCALSGPAVNLKTSNFPLPPPLISTRGTHLASSIPSLPLFSSSSPPPCIPPPPFTTTTTPLRLPVHPTRRRNDVLIMRLLGRQIALGLIRMRWKIAAVLESPTPPHPNPTATAAATPTPLRVSGRLTLASCRGTVIRHKGRCSVSLCVTAAPQRKQRPPDGTRHRKAGRMG